MTQEEAEKMGYQKAIQILEPLQKMMLDNHGCPISTVYFALGKAIEALKAQLFSKGTTFGKWIPCSERLPEDDTLMLVNYIDRRPDAVDIWIGWHEMENVWYIDGEAHSREDGNEVVAWMPLPEPWEEDK